ncbi:MAG: protein of unknown function transrane [Acidimicrobiales bacterium]|nr:protein of unknown function transrane [Acidimicrobiales bacterium]
MAAVLALLSSLTWGTGDFLGGTMARRLHPVAVMWGTQGLALVGFFVVALVSGQLGAPLAYAPWGIAAGLAGVLGLGCFYSALATGKMGVVAPIAACEVLVPVVAGFVAGESPRPVQMAGIGLIIVGIVLAAGPERGTVADPAHPARPADPLPGDPLPPGRVPAAALAAVAAVAFGTALLCLAHGSRHNIVMTLLTMRVVNVLVTTTLLLTVLRSVDRLARPDLGVTVAVAATDGGGNALYAVASTMGLLSLTTVLASLYPAVTALLAWKVHHERLRPIQVAGVVTTLAGVAAIAAG